MKAYAQGGMFGAIGAALVTAAGIYAASQAANIKIPTRSKSSSSSVSSPSISAPSIPSFTENLTADISTDESAAAINAQSREPLKAYVVLDDISDANNTMNSIESNSTL
jgi:hypothetical protein